MSNARLAVMPVEPIDVRTRNFYLRPITIEDASDRWASWFDQEEVRECLNLQPGRKMSADIANYIRKFDQRNKHPDRHVRPDE